MIKTGRSYAAGCIAAGTAVFLLGILSGPSGCRQGEKAENVLIVTLDTQRADFLSCFQSGSAVTPNLDRLAADGLICPACYSPIPITLPAHASIFHSRLPHELRVFNNGEKVPRSEVTPLPEVFARNGYATAAFVSMGVLQPEYGLDRGFQEYSGRFPEAGRYYSTAEEVNRKVLPWLERNHGRPIFLWVHYSDPHAPYRPPGIPPECRISLDGGSLGDFSLDETLHELRLTVGEGSHTIEFSIDNPDRQHLRRKLARFRTLILEDAGGRGLLDDDSAEGWTFNFKTGIHTCARLARLSIPPGSRGTVRLAFQGSLSIPREKLRELYRREVEYMDARIGELFKTLRRLGLWNRTHILVVGDHGEGLGEYRKSDGTLHFGHIRYLYDVYLRVPLIVRSPSLPKTGVKIMRLTSLLDVAPTVLDLMGWKNQAGYLGSSVLRKLPEGPRSLFQATFRPESDRDRFGLLQPPYHMILTPEDDLIELYNIEEDPGEKNNLYPDSASSEPAADLRRRLLTGARRILKARRIRAPDSRTEEMLRALGYIR